MKTKKVFSLFLAMDLCRMGNKIIGLELNKQQNKQVYVFEYTEKFEKDFTKIKEEYNKKS